MIRTRLTYANVVASLALFVALGGTSVAATSLISGAKIKQNSIPANRIKKGSLTAIQVNLTKLGTSLTDKLQNASNFVAAGQVSQACGTLTGFLHQVSAQKGKALTVVQAAALAARVIRIRNDIGC